MMYRVRVPSVGFKYLHLVKLVLHISICTFCNSLYQPEILSQGSNICLKRMITQENC